MQNRSGNYRIEYRRMIIIWWNKYQTDISEHIKLKSRTDTLSNEIEVKLMAEPLPGSEAVDAEMIKRHISAVLNAKGAFILKSSEKTLNNSYYDTENQDLYRSGIALRVRVTNSYVEATVKTRRQSTGGIHIHPEYNVDLTAKPDVPRLDLFPEEIFSGLDRDFLQSHIYENMAQSCIILTAGISLNNGLKVFLTALVTRRKRFFEWRFLLLAVILPCAMIWGFARWEYRTYVWPKEMARNEVKAKKNREYTEKIRLQARDSIGSQDSLAVEALTKKIKNQKAKEKYRRDHQKIWNKNTGKPIAKGEFMRWTDKTTSRWDVALECFLGEGIQLHKDYLLGDVLRNRPLIVRYDTSNILGYINYLVEAVIVLLFLIGVWIGRKKIFLWTAMSFLILDMALHMGLGFGINEIYIMSAHYLFVLPIGIAYLFKAIEARERSYMAVTAACALTAVWCFVWNITNIIGYCL